MGERSSRPPSGLPLRLCKAGGRRRSALRQTLKPTKGADDGLRTRDLQLGKLALYQLSYVRVGGYFSTPEVDLSLF